jgi:hypothetical protein
MTRERRLNDFLLAVTKSIFQELISMDAVMLKIMVTKKIFFLLISKKTAVLL